MTNNASIILAGQGCGGTGRPAVSYDKGKTFSLITDLPVTQWGYTAISKDGSTMLLSDVNNGKVYVTSWRTGKSLRCDLNVGIFDIVHVFF